MKKLQIARTPTPLHRLSRISNRWQGKIWVKRDDLTGSGLTGNKVRKLEYLLADAKDQGCDTLITCGAVQSNHCRATALAARQQGFDVHLLLRGSKPEIPDGNLLIDHFVDARMSWISADAYYRDLESELNALSEQVRAIGFKPYIIPEGGSNALGAFAYIEALKEIKAQCNEQNVNPQRIICATGSAGTHAGLLAGCLATGWDVKIISVAVCYDEHETRSRIAAILLEILDKGLIKFSFTDEDILVVDKYLGEGYGIANAEIFEVIREMATCEGVLLDPVYTGKAATGLKSETQNKNWSGTSILLHSGGFFGTFPYKNQIKNQFGW